MTKNSNLPTGWLCPRCGNINAPFIYVCSCDSSYMNISEDSAPRKEFCEHEWECIGVSTVGTSYRCKKCFASKTEPILNL